MCYKIKGLHFACRFWYVQYFGYFSFVLYFLLAPHFHFSFFVVVGGSFRLPVLFILFTFFNITFHTDIKLMEIWWSFFLGEAENFIMNVPTHLYSYIALYICHAFPSFVFSITLPFTLFGIFFSRAIIIFDTHLHLHTLNIIEIGWCWLFVVCVCVAQRQKKAKNNWKHAKVLEVDTI